jgi:uncharacterized PurR-regulated membrane protein YhhQ (DUF165 family)
MFGNENEVERKIAIRREVIFVVLSGLFLGTLAVLNILGISRQIDLSFNLGTVRIPFVVFVGVLPYPITFLCTDFISELYGKRRANMVVWVGLALNIWVLFILWLGAALLDTLPFYVETRWLSRYLQIDPNQGYLEGKD